MPYAYVTVTTIKSTGVLNVDGTAYDTRLRRLAEDISEQIDRSCNRFFQPRTITRYFDGDASTKLLTPELISVTTLKEDDNQDGTYDISWAAADYLLMPHNAQPTEDWGRPYHMIMVSPKSNGTQDSFMAGPKRYEVVGTWGYVQVTRDPGVDTSGSLGSTATTANVNTAGIEPGMTVLVDSEQMYVEATGSNSLTVRRAVNGSTAGTHASGVDVKYYHYPGPIQEAAIIQVSRIWKRKDSGFANQVGFADTGVMVTWRGGLDPDVKELLTSYRRLRV